MKQLLDDWRPAAVAAVLCGVWYAALITRFDFDLLRRDSNGLVFNSMLHNLLAGRFDVAPGAIGEEGFRRGGLVYTYFGIVPALLRLPLLLARGALATDVTTISIVIAAMFGAFWQLRAIAALRVAVAGRRNAEMLLTCLALGAVLGGPQVQFLRSLIYEEVIHWAGAFAAMFVCWAVIGLTAADGFTTRVLTRMALAAGLALTTRVSTGLGLYAALALLMVVRAWPGRFAIVAWARRLLAPPFLAPAVILSGFLGVTLALNWARWGNPLTVVDLRDHIMNASFPDRLGRVLATGEFNPGRMWFGVLYYFVPIWIFYRPGGPLVFADYQQRMVETELPPGSFFLSDPLLVALCGVFLIRVWRSGRAAGAAVALAAGLALPALMMFGLVFMNFRYRQEFYPFLTLTALAGVLRLACDGGGWVVRWRWPMAVAGVLFAHGFLWLYVKASLGPADVTLVQSLIKSLGR